MARKSSTMTVRLKAASVQLSAVAAQASKYVEETFAGIAHEAAESTRRRNPRSDSGSDHMADGWTSRTTREGDTIVGEVFNTLARVNEPIELKSGEETTLAHIIEYGSRPHTFGPKDPSKFLVFVADGKVVRAKQVEHPGTRPYAMLSTARIEAALNMKKTLDAVNVVVALALQGRTGTLKKPNPFGQGGN